MNWQIERLPKPTGPENTKQGATLGVTRFFRIVEQTRIDYRSFPERTLGILDEQGGFLLF